MSYFLDYIILPLLAPYIYIYVGASGERTRFIPKSIHLLVHLQNLDYAITNKTTGPLATKLGKWIDYELEILHILLFLFYFVYVI